MLPTSEQYRYITDGEHERSVALEKDQRIYARPVNLDGAVNAAAVEKLYKMLAPLYKKQTALAKSGRVIEAEKIEAEISVLLKQQAPDAVREILPDNMSQDGREAHKIASYVLATALANYANKDIYSGYAHVREKNGDVILQELQPHEKTFRKYLQYQLNRTAAGLLPEGKRLRQKNGAEEILRHRQEQKFRNDELIRKNFSNPKNRQKASKAAAKKGRPLTEKEIKVMKLKAVGSKGK